jgi:hypothetical protein
MYGQDLQPPGSFGIKYYISLYIVPQHIVGHCMYNLSTSFPHFDPAPVSVTIYIRKYMTLLRVTSYFHFHLRLVRLIIWNSIIDLLLGLELLIGCMPGMHAFCSEFIILPMHWFFFLLFSLISIHFYFVRVTT